MVGLNDLTHVSISHALSHWFDELIFFLGLKWVVVSNTFTREWELEPYYELAKKYGYQVHSLIVENRHGGVNEHGVPEDKLQAMKDRFEIKL